MVVIPYHTQSRVLFFGERACGNTVLWYMEQFYSSTKIWVFFINFKNHHSWCIGQLFPYVCYTSAGTEQGSSPDTSTVSVIDLQQRVNQTVDKVKQALTPLRDPTQRSLLQRNLQDLTALTNTLVSSVESHRSKSCQALFFPT